MESEEIEEALAQNITCIVLRVRLAEAYVREERLDEALVQYREAMRRLYLSKRYDEYLQVAERLLHFNAQDLTVRRRVVKQHLRLENYKRALSHLRVLFVSGNRELKTFKSLARCFQRFEAFDKEAKVRCEAGRIYASRGDSRQAR